MEHGYDTAVLDRIFEPVSRCLTPEVAFKLVQLRADLEVQARIEELAEKANEGQLSPEEYAEYETYVEAIDFIGILQAKARAILEKTSDS